MRSDRVTMSRNEMSVTGLLRSDRSIGSHCRDESVVNRPLRAGRLAPHAVLAAQQVPAPATAGGILTTRPIGDSGSPQCRASFAHRTLVRDPTEQPNAAAMEADAPRLKRDAYQRCAPISYGSMWFLGSWLSPARAVIAEAQSLARAEAEAEKFRAPARPGARQRGGSGPGPRHSGRSLP